jgi:thiosulfate dehydrogenase
MKRHSIILLTTGIISVGGGIIFSYRRHVKHTVPAAEGPSEVKKIGTVWVAPDSSLIPNTEEGLLIRYGRELIRSTSLYFGPAGRISRQANGMNCQNCHLEAGTRNFANPFSGVAALYPQFRPRSGRIESVEFKINECLERSLNGKKIDSACREMRSMVAYIKWLGNGIPRGLRPPGAGTAELALMDRPADSGKGSIVFRLKCQTCHGQDGQGLLNADQTAYLYPPLWGEHSYNTSAGMHRITKLAGYIKYAMPFGTRYPIAQLSDEEIWDVAAFVNSKPRPAKFFLHDWPVLKTKPFDYPYGPYADSFPERQHKYGPFVQIKNAAKVQLK